MCISLVGVDESSGGRLFRVLNALSVCAQAQLIDDALDLNFDGLRTNTREHMMKVPEASQP